tara:strand:- start:381 stop:638 length:258 start_codon:yes stop_codon:yes gene_type:complete
MIVEAAIEEDVNAIGISILSGAHQILVPKVMEILFEKDLGNIPVFVGGIVPENDVEELIDLGVVGVFGPGTSTSEIVRVIRDAIS